MCVCVGTISSHASHAIRLGSERFILSRSAAYQNASSCHGSASAIQNSWHEDGGGEGLENFRGGNSISEIVLLVVSANR